jgi:hypothetical protein
MREENRLLLAIEAAIAAARVLHPEDFVGVIQFNTKASAVLELTKAGNLALIEDRISRLEPRGGTSFGPPLELAREIFGASKLGVRHAILLSDGDSRPYLLKPLVTEMADEGITLSTVACGAQSNEQALSDLAYWGRGKFLPAHNAKSVPQIFTIEAQRIIKETGARSRDTVDPNKEQPKPNNEEPVTPPDPEEEKPKPPEDHPEPTTIRNAWPAPYMQGLKIHEALGVMGFHRTRVRPWGWVSVETTESQDPIMAHGYVGRGRVIALSTALDGPWAAPLLVANDYSVLLSQSVRFLSPERGASRFQLEILNRGREAEVTVYDQFEEDLPTDLTFELLDGEGELIPFDVRDLSENEWVIAPGAHSSAASALLRVRSASRSGLGEAELHFDQPIELRDLPSDGNSPMRWATALGGELRTDSQVELEIPHRTHVVRDAISNDWYLLLAALLMVEFLLRRVVRL